jgi:hypothetical protein
VIDLHTHTTASDGRCAPEELVARAVAAGVDVLSVTDHDTTAAASASAAACADAGIEFVPGIEITAVLDGVDVHVLGYFLNPHAAGLSAFLATQRKRRVDRVRQIIDRLAALGIALDADAILRPSESGDGKAAGRPWIARALVAGGYVASEQIHAANGIASLAHPGLLKRDDLISGFVAAGLDALEAYHGKHSTEDTSRYIVVARQHGLAVSGGSDYHGDPSHDAGGLGSTSLPAELFQDLKGRWATRRATASGLSPSTTFSSS